MMRALPFHVTYQQAVRAVFTILISSGLLFGAVGLIQHNWLITVIAGCGLLIDLALVLAYQRGWRYAPAALVLLMAGFVNMALQSDTVTGHSMLWALLPMVIALILTDAVWTALAALITLLIQLLGPSSGAFYREPEVLGGYLVITLGLLVSRLILEHALATASASARHAEQETTRATVALALAEQRADELAVHSAMQQQLLDTIATLETPAITLADGVLFAPMVGHFDAQRAQRIMTHLLQTAHAQHARHVILDVTGMPLLADAAASALIQTAQALRLLGCTVAVSGISASAASHLVAQELALDGISTAANPQQALLQVR
jgi:anti-anti-sigma regulatory factor